MADNIFTRLNNQYLRARSTVTGALTDAYNSATGQSLSTEGAAEDAGLGTDNNVQSGGGYGQNGEGSPHYGQPGYKPNGPGNDWIKDDTSDVWKIKPGDPKAGDPKASKTDESWIYDAVDKVYAPAPPIDFDAYAEESGANAYYASLMGDTSSAIDQQYAQKWNKDQSGYVKDLARRGIRTDESGLAKIQTTFNEQYDAPRALAQIENRYKINAAKRTEVTGGAEAKAARERSDAKEALAIQIKTWVDTKVFDADQKAYWTKRSDDLAKEARTEKTQIEKDNREFILNLGATLINLGNLGVNIAKLPSDVVKNVKPDVKVSAIP